ncbi:MAG: HEPN domain-containing protein [Sedimentisphaerales bacterium]|nr:HEPN domain-containing protein [Sedimentisphaerales bacterium]
MTAKEARSDIVRYWWSKARDSLASARREFEAGSYAFAVNRLYYVAFYGACAALLERQQSFRKHSGVRAAFHRQFIKTGVLDVKWGRLYDRLFEDRQEGDYVVFISFEPEYVQLQLEQCTQFLEEPRMVPSSLDEARG